MFYYDSQKFAKITMHHDGNVLILINLLMMDVLVVVHDLW